VKEKRTYKRFELISFLAILGCAGMLIFEGIFIFELYDRAALKTQSKPAPAAKPTVAPVSVPVQNATPAPRSEPVVPADVPPAEIDKTPVVAPVG